jgi:hypothetical protein
VEIGVTHLGDPDAVYRLPREAQVRLLAWWRARGALYKPARRGRRGEQNGGTAEGKAWFFDAIGQGPR